MRAWRACIARAVARAQRSGGTVLAVSTARLREAPDPLELFDAAERRGEPRFLLVHPEEGFALLALGCAAEVGGEPTPAQASAQIAAWLEGETELDPAEPLFVAGQAFAHRDRSERETAWQAFGNGRLQAPELLFTWRGAAARLTRMLAVGPAAGARQLEERRRVRESELLAKGPSAASRAAVRTPFPAPDRCYRAAAAHAIAAIRRGELEKVVLAQAIARPLPGDFRCGPVLTALIRGQPTSCSFAVGQGDATFLGATPERLVRCGAGRVESHAVAGTAAGGSRREQLGAALRRSAKERGEHAIVVRAIVAALRPLCSELSLAAEPELAQAGGVQHLRTRIKGRMRGMPQVLDLVARLHPTPALGGAPREAALRWIARHEGFDRGWYGGPIGWLDASGGGDFFVALRCGLVHAGRAVAYAGSGLVAGSDPDREMRETAQKLRTLWEALDAG